MARLPQPANTEGNNEGLDNFIPLPAGDYIAQITQSQYKETKAKDGIYLQLIWKVVSGEYKGRTIFDNLNLDNPNKVAVEIANKSLNSICQACDKVGVQDSEELHGIPCKLTLIIQKATTTQPAGNNIRGYSKAEDVVIEQTDDSAAPAETQEDEAPAKTEKKLPWE